MLSLNTKIVDKKIRDTDEGELFYRAKICEIWDGSVDKEPSRQCVEGFYYLLVEGKKKFIGENKDENTKFGVRLELYGTRNINLESETE